MTDFDKIEAYLGGDVKPAKVNAATSIYASLIAPTRELIDAVIYLAFVDVRLGKHDDFYELEQLDYPRHGEDDMVGMLSAMRESLASEALGKRRCGWFEDPARQRTIHQTAARLVREGVPDDEGHCLDMRDCEAMLTNLPGKGLGR